MPQETRAKRQANNKDKRKHNHQTDLSRTLNSGFWLLLFRILLVLTIGPPPTWLFSGLTPSATGGIPSAFAAITLVWDLEGVQLKQPNISMLKTRIIDIIFYFSKLSGLTNVSGSLTMLVGSWDVRINCLVRLVKHTQYFSDAHKSLDVFLSDQWFLLILSFWWWLLRLKIWFWQMVIMRSGGRSRKTPS